MAVDVHEMSDLGIGKRFIAASSTKTSAGAGLEREMLVHLLREFARRTAQDHRGNPEAAYPQLRRIHALGRELLARKWAETGHPSFAKAGTMLRSVTVR